MQFSRSRRLCALPLGWVLLLPAGPEIAAADIPPPPAVGAPTGVDALFASPTTKDHIGRVVVPVMIDGRGPYRFIIDTGANHSTITPSLVAELGLKASEQASITVNGITGTAQASFVTVGRLQAGDLRMDKAVLPVVWAPVMAGADGILGMAGLGDKSVIIDFQRNRVEIAPRMQPLWNSQAMRIHARAPIGGLIALDSRIAGNRVVAIIDTGAERTLGNMALKTTLKKTSARGITAQITSVYGTTEQIETGEIMRTPNIAIDSLFINDVSIVYGDFHIFEVWGLKDRPAVVIGMDVLGTVASLSIDFKNQDIYITSVHDANLRPFDAHALGEASVKR